MGQLKEPGHEVAAIRRSQFTTSRRILLFPGVTIATYIIAVFGSTSKPVVILSFVGATGTTILAWIVALRLLPFAAKNRHRGHTLSVALASLALIAMWITFLTLLFVVALHVRGESFRSLFVGLSWADLVGSAMLVAILWSVVMRDLGIGW